MYKSIKKTRENILYYAFIRINMRAEMNLL